jgi:hypothetical protein
MVSVCTAKRVHAFCMDGQTILIFNRLTFNSFSWNHVFTLFSLRSILISLIFSSTCTPSKQSFSFKFSEQNFVWISHLSYACYISWSCHHIWFHCIRILSEVYKLWRFLLFNFLHLSITSFLGPTLIWNAFNLCSSLRVMQVRTPPPLKDHSYRSFVSAAVSLLPNTITVRKTLPRKGTVRPVETCSLSRLKWSCVLMVCAPSYLKRLAWHKTAFYFTKGNSGFPIKKVGWRKWSKRPLRKT